MIIKDIMVRDVIVTSPSSTISDALQKMERNRIRHLPVVNDNKEIVGIISDRDLRDASPSIFDKKSEGHLDLPIEKIMITDVLTAFAGDFVEDAANTMTENQISCLPIEDNGKIIGIITETDLLYTLVKLTGADLPSSRLEVEVENKSGMLSNVAQIIKEHNINIHSALVYPATNISKKILVFRVQAMDIRPLTQAIISSGYRVLWPSNLEMNI
ncbi:acetoin utilization AcuB family protein [Evansella tamaricis]|uniref:Acetoin utilization AcuB family protein n=1 Tax=Evansella tamaricis TaxID=2069301 RepID=A0ABS6JMT3_9BACI|nr:acetoin utilization AcuB family protein [Evansella tamaricis]MBU9714675.1 acetoin utilization AcuB family protein [Evansella tamaricis]